jgi:hypothetical protein
MHTRTDDALTVKLNMCATTAIPMPRTVQKDRNPTDTLHKGEIIQEIIQRGTIAAVMMLTGEMKTVMSGFQEWKHLPHISILNPLFLKYIIRVIISRRWTWHVACMGKKRDAYRILVGRPEAR